jgi:hypothetical protein
MKTVGPTTKTKAARMTASTMLMLDRYWMPRADARDRRQHEADGQPGDEQHQEGVAGLPDPADDLGAVRDLQGTQAQRGRRAEQGREDREHVDDLAAGP